MRTPILTIAIPTKCSINAKTVISILNLMNGNIGQYNICIRILDGKSNIHHIRSIMTSQWYDTSEDQDVFLFVDADQTFTKKDILDLLELNSDVACGVYSSSSGKPTVFPKDPETFFKGKSNELYYGATGFMLIRRPILGKIFNFLKKEHGSNPRFWISTNENNIIPFFKERFIDSELNPGTSREWLGEDYSFCWTVRQVSGVIMGKLSATIGHEVMNIKYFFPDTFEGEKWERNTIVYYTGNSLVKWSPEVIGLGGSESAVIELTSRWVKKGYNVTVYGNVFEGEYGNVKYISHTKFPQYDIFNILILWRGFGLQMLNKVKAQQLIVDLHDNTDKKFFSESLKNKISKVIFKSNFHRNLFPIIPDSKSLIIPNGVKINEIESVEKCKRNPYRCMYTSSYDRGLEHMLMWGWPLIIKEIPQAELHVFYGMELVRDKDFIQKMNFLLKQKGVYNHGKVSHDVILQEYKKTTFHYYITSDPYTEIDCISVKESLYSGCIPVIGNLAVFKERSGMHMDGDPTKKETHVEIAHKMSCMMKRPKVIEFFQEKLKKEIPGDIVNWDRVSESWKKIFI